MAIFVTSVFVPRMKSTASCKMNLRNYPMDDQICHLALESCEYFVSPLFAEFAYAVLVTIWLNILLSENKASFPLKFQFL